MFKLLPVLFYIIVFSIITIYNITMLEKILNVITSPVLIYCLCILFFILFIVQTSKIRKIRESNKKTRADAIKRSKSVINGQIVEQLAPYLPKFPCNPADAKFLGKPVDFVAFSGLAEKDKVDEILLIEVKTGKSDLTSREREIKKAVKEGRVRYIEYRAFSDK